MIWKAATRARTRGRIMAQFTMRLRKTSAARVSESRDRPSLGARKLVYSRRWRRARGPGSPEVWASQPANCLATSRKAPLGDMDAVRRWVHAINHEPMYPPPETVER